jgi:hypothetical protein
MSTKRDTGADEGFDVEGDESYSILQGVRVRPEKPKPTRVYFYPLPNYAQDHRHDPRSRDTENSVMLPYANGYLERFESTAEAGFYFVEMRAGREILGGDVHEVKPKGLSEVDRAKPQPEASAAAPVLERKASSAQNINDTTETIRATKELIKEVSPQGAPQLGREDVARMISDAMRDALASVQPTRADASLDPLQMVDRVIELQKKLAPPKQTAEGDEFDRVIALMDRVQTMQERIAPRSVDDEPSFLGKASAFVETIGRNAPALAPFVVPMLPARLQAMLGATGAADAMPTSEAQPQSAGTQAQPQAARPPQNEQEAFQLMLHVVVSDLIKNKRVGRAADLIDELCIRFPTFATATQELCNAAPADMLAMVSQYSGRSDLATYGHALGYIESLQDELRRDDEQSEDAIEEGEQSGAVPNIVEMASARAS